MKIYLGLSISGRSYDDVVKELQFKKELFESFGYTILSPMTGKSYLRNEIEFKAHDSPSTNHAIFERDCWMVAKQADIIFMDFTNSSDRVSIGGVMELAIGSYAGKHTVSVIPKTSIHNHAFVLEASDIVFETAGEAYTYFEKLIKQDV